MPRRQVPLAREQLVQLAQARFELCLGYALRSKVEASFCLGDKGQLLSAQAAQHGVHRPHLPRQKVPTLFIHFCGSDQLSQPLCVVSQRPHIFTQCRPAVDRLLAGGETAYLVYEGHVDDLRAMDTSNVFGVDKPQFDPDSPELKHMAGDCDRAVLLGKDALFPNVVEAALSLGARETLYVDFYGNVMELTSRTLDEHRRHSESFRTRWLAALDESDLVKARDR